MLVCALTIDDVSADCAVDTSVSVLEIIEFLAAVIASEIDCKFTAANDGVEVRDGTPVDTSLNASADIKA